MLKKKKTLDGLRFHELDIRMHCTCAVCIKSRTCALFRSLKRAWHPSCFSSARCIFGRHVLVSEDVTGIIQSVSIQIHLLQNNMRPLMFSTIPALLFIILIRDLNTEIYSSTARLSALMNIEREIVGQIQKYIKDIEAKTSRLRNFIDAFNNIMEPTDTDEVVTNPLSAYKLIKQLVVDWENVEQLLNESSWQVKTNSSFDDYLILDLIQQVQSHRNSSLRPKYEDLEGAAFAIVRLQETYRLNASDLARGNVLGIQSSIGLTSNFSWYQMILKKIQRYNFLTLFKY
uniref:Prolyl 4-hydroxylase N-terminal domain-containing protein n=1 Tax=Strigamia maritima TaxID=126957 RepID=T1JFP4_STRMM